MRYITSTLLLLLSLSTEAQYFQQEVNYEIKVRLDDEGHFLHATEKIEYVNNSPDTLNELYFHLWPNAYKGKGTALEAQLARDGNFDLSFPREEIIGYIDSLDFKVDGKSVEWEQESDAPDIAMLKLNRALNPGEKISVSTPFRVKIPSGRLSRLGHIEQQYQITQWYPKPAVYDDEGWHAMPYLTQGEFYSEYGSFDVEISVPLNYVLGASGNLMTESETQWLDSLSTVKPDKQLWEEWTAEFPESSNDFKTLKFKAENVHDFAWFCDKRYRVMKSEVSLPNSGRKVTTWAMFSPKGGKEWEKATGYLNDAIHYYSLWNGDYAYDQMTAVEGALSAGAGMEYPNITVIGSANSDILLEQVIMHETGHQWFYGMLGSNERDYPWMDEGMNSYCEIRYMETKYSGGGFEIPEKVARPLQLEDFTHYSYHQLLYFLSAKRNSDQPISLHSADYKSLNYGAIVYSKTALWFRYLQEYLGKETMDQCLKNYFDEWRFKHPGPEDLKASFEKKSGKDLAWFFDSFEHTDKLDQKLKLKSSKEGVHELKLKQKAGLDFPVEVALLQNDSVIDAKWSRAGALVLNGEGDQLKIDPNNRIPDYNKQNDQVKTSGLFKSTEPLAFKFLGALESPERSEVYHFPAYGYNSADGSMIGWNFYNRALYQKKLEWNITPMYAFHSNRLTGIAQLRVNQQPLKKGLSDLQYGINARRFSWSGFLPVLDANNDLLIQDYIRLAPFIEIRHNEAKDNSKWQFFSRAEAVVLYNSVLSDFYGTEELDAFGFVSHMMDRDNGKSKQRLVFNSAFSEGLFNTDFSYQTSMAYNRKGNRLKTRLFLGATWDNTRGPNFDYNISGQNGDYDYAFNQLFLDRAGVSSFWSRQRQFNHGGIKTGFRDSPNASELLGVSVEFDLPILGLGLFSNLVLAELENTRNYFDAGVYLSLIPEICTVYMPIVAQAGHQGNGVYLVSPEQIRFTLHLNKLNPFKLIDGIEF